MPGGRAFAAPLPALFMLAVLAVSAGGCHRDPPPRIRLAVIERCEDSVARAVKQNDPKKALRLYHEKCADLFVERGCRDAFFAAGKAPPQEQDTMSLTACARDYCPLLGDRKLAACEPSFTPSPVAVAFAWQPLLTAIVEHDARGYAPRVNGTLASFQMVMAARAGAVPLSPAMLPSGAAPAP